MNQIDVRSGESLSEETANPVLSFLLGRRSTVAKLLGEPGPSDAELQLILRAGARVPDHGKLTPWRFIVAKGEARRQLGEGLAEAFAAANPDADENLIAEERARPSRAPVIVAVVSTAAPHPKIPVWEQELSAGAACQTMLSAAIALGYGAQWLTEWWAYDEGAARVWGLQAGERAAGFIYIGTYGKPLQERPRPDLDDIVTDWRGPA